MGTVEREKSPHPVKAPTLLPRCCPVLCDPQGIAGGHILVGGTFLVAIA
jgi:hypothetical protein